MLSENAKQRLQQAVDETPEYAPGIFENWKEAGKGLAKILGLALVGIIGLCLVCWLFVAVCTLIFNGSIWIVDRISSWAVFYHKNGKEWGVTDYVLLVLFLYCFSNTRVSKNTTKS